MNSSCKECDSPLIGRSDKKFCNDYCRTSYHSRRNRVSNNTIRFINMALQKNRRILADYAGKYGLIICRDSLLRLSFNFRYSTHRYTIDGEKKLVRCYYDYAIISQDNNNYEIVKLEDPLSPIFQKQAIQHPYQKVSVHDHLTPKG